MAHDHGILGDQVRQKGSKWIIEDAISSDVKNQMSIVTHWRTYSSKILEYPKFCMRCLDIPKFFKVHGSQAKRS